MPSLETSSCDILLKVESKMKIGKFHERKINFSVGQDTRLVTRCSRREIFMTEIFTGAVLPKFVNMLRRDGIFGFYNL